jgi:hypothetical protein
MTIFNSYVCLPESNMVPVRSRFLPLHFHTRLVRYLLYHALLIKTLSTWVELRRYKVKEAQALRFLLQYLVFLWNIWLNLVTSPLAGNFALVPETGWDPTNLPGAPSSSRTVALLYWSHAGNVSDHKQTWMALWKSHLAIWHIPPSKWLNKIDSLIIPVEIHPQFLWMFQEFT